MMVIDKEAMKLQIAAQLLLQGFPEQEVCGGFTLEEVAKARAIAEELQKKRNDMRPPAAALTTTGWLRRRILLHITEIPSKKLAMHRRNGNA